MYSYVNFLPTPVVCFDTITCSQCILRFGETTEGAGMRPMACGFTITLFNPFHCDLLTRIFWNMSKLITE